MLEKPDTDYRIKIRLFSVIKEITESIINLDLKGATVEDVVTLMEEKTAQTIAQIDRFSREGGKEEQLEGSVDDQAKF